MTKRYSTCQTVGELREALSGIPDDVALFGDVEEDRYVSVTVDLDKVSRTGNYEPVSITEIGYPLFLGEVQK